MSITFDPVKDKQNQSKHLVSLAEAAKLEWEWLLVGLDRRREYGELRMVG